MVTLGVYPAPAEQNVVPCSDMAGEVVAIGAKVQKWKVGDRVSVNMTLDRVTGNMEPEMFVHGLGSNEDGVLTEYRTFPDHVGFLRLLKCLRLILKHRSHWSPSQSIYHIRRHLLCRRFWLILNVGLFSWSHCISHIALRCAALTAWNALQGSVPMKGGDYVLIQGTGGVAMYVNRNKDAFII